MNKFEESTKNFQQWCQYAQIENLNHVHLSFINPNLLNFVD